MSDSMSMSWPVDRPGAQAFDSDLAAIHAAASGEKDALQWIYERHGPRILSYLRGQLRDPALAEEVLQDVMLAAWRGAAGFRGESKLSTWLLTIAHRRAINARRRKQLPREPIDETRAAELPRAAPADRGTALRMDLRRALDQLAPEHRACLELFFYHELSIAGIAQVLDLPAGTVKSRLHRAKAQLRAVLDRTEGESYEL